ncbi:MAG: sigma 54-interacting transcriptional regulator [Planctomycetota bacterium]
MDAIRQAEATFHEIVEDPNLTIIFFELWISLCTKIGRLDEADILVKRGHELLTPDMPPEIHGSVLIGEGLLAGVRGDTAARERTFDKVLGLLPPDSPRRKIIVWDRAIFFGIDARIGAVEEDLAWLAARGFPPSRVALARCFGLAEAGRVQEALSQRSGVERDSVLMQYNKSMQESSRCLLELMSGAPQPPSARDSHPEWPVWAQSTQMLLDRRTGDALRLAREWAVAPPGGSTSGFENDTLVRAEMAAGNGEAARRLIEQRRARGGAHYLDDLHLARMEMLSGDRDTAARHFAAVIRAAEVYKTEARLNFELRLACELSPGGLVTLARAAAALPDRGPRRHSSPETADVNEPRGVERLIGRSPAMTALRESILRFAPLDVPVLITGETGTGKELVAQAIHETGPRAGAPYLAVNCGAITESLLETEIFGHEKGAFTGASRAHRGIFEEAGKGTVLLDEIGEISPRLQVTLLRVLETGEIRPVGSATTRRIHCRILAATNADLERLAAEGRFRKDLIYRLRRLTVHIEPLRARREDILTLADFFLVIGRRDGRRPVMSPELRAAFERRDWPGNVREIKNEIERMRLLNSDRLDYSLADFGKEAASHAGSAGAPPARPSASPPSADISEEDLLLSGRTPLRRTEKIRQLFMRHGKLTRAEVARLVAVSNNTASADLKRLCHEGIIEKIMPTASPRTHYFRLISPPAPGHPGRC